jgi:hypothetical protein
MSEKTVVQFPAIAPASDKISPDGWHQPEKDAQTLAILGAMPIIEYERERRRAAKVLGWRPSFLDKRVNCIRNAIANYCDWERDEQTKPGRARRLDDGGVAFEVVTLRRGERLKTIAILPDNQGTLITGTPF